MGRGGNAAVVMKKKKRSTECAPAAGKHKKQKQDSNSKADSTSSFLRWCQSVKVRHGSSTVGPIPNSGVRGVIASKDVKQGEVVVQVPDDVVLMVENCCIAKELQEAGLAKGVADDPLFEVQGLVLAVMAEKAAGKRSSWAPYLNFIPQDMGHMPMYWQEQELRELQGTAALDKMEGRVQTPSDAPTQVQTLWQELAQPFILEHPRLNLPHGDKGYALYRWATAAVSSYSFILGDDKFQAMVPYWDALNHVTGAVNVRLNHHTGKGGKGCLQMIAVRDIKEGEELVNNYGELSQAELLRAYGYIERHADANLYAHVQVPLNFVLQALAAFPHPATSKAVSDAARESCGSDSDGASSWDLSGSEDEAEDSEAADDEEPQRPAPNGAAAANGAKASQSQPSRPGAQGKASAAHAPAASPQERQHEQQQRRGGVGKAVRGLPGRLRFLRRVALLPKARVLKLHFFSPLLATHSDAGTPSSANASAPQSSVGGGAQRRDGASQLAECVRLLQLPWEEFVAVRERVASWRPDGAAPAVTAAANKSSKAAKNSKAAKSSQAIAATAAPPTVVDVGLARCDDAAAQRVLGALRYVAVHMLGRYTCSLEEDEQRLATAATDSTQVPDRLLSAMVARMPEKQCLLALKRWAGQGEEGCSAAVRAAAVACWGQARPGMFGQEGSDSDEEGSSEEGGSDEEDTDDEGEEEEDSEGEEASEAEQEEEVQVRVKPAVKRRGGSSQAWANKQPPQTGSSAGTGAGVSDAGGGEFKFGFKL